MLKKLSTTNLIQQYSEIINELKERGVIRTKNLIGDLGEYLAIDYYCNTAGLPKLQAAMTNTKKFDAISMDGETYSIKSITGRLTGVFYGLEPPKSKKSNDKLFDYAIIVLLNDNYALNKILELNWEIFLKHKRWHKTMTAWNLPITKSLIEDCNIIYSE